MEGGWNRTGVKSFSPLRTLRFLCLPSIGIFVKKVYFPFLVRLFPFAPPRTYRLLLRTLTARQFFSVRRRFLQDFFFFFPFTPFSILFFGNQLRFRTELLLCDAFFFPPFHMFQPIPFFQVTLMKRLFFWGPWVLP